MSNNASFLPEDYLAQKVERRTNLISLVLFGVVMLGVFLAFLVTNQKWSKVKTAQLSINEQYQQAAQQIKALTELEQQKEEMLHKAELAAALVERVPRSILLAELINRMPDRLSLLDFELKSEVVKTKPPKAEGAAAGDAKTGRLQPKRAKTKEQATQEQAKIEPPRYDVSIVLVGIAPGDLEVSRFLSELNGYPLFRDVTLDYTEQKEIRERAMRQFKISMKLDPGADMRDVDPLILPRTVRDPMDDELRFSPGAGPAPGATADVDPSTQRKEH